MPPKMPPKEDYMGAFDFYHDIDDDIPAEQAFTAAVQQAAWDHGHSGYTGTIAEKTEFVIITNEPMDRPDAQDLAEKLINEGDERINDKWGPAGAIPIKGGGWLFFGWASS